MSDQQTSKEMAEFTKTILDAMNSMYENLSEKIERSETRMKAYIENGVEKKVDLLAERVDALSEKVDSIDKRQATMEEHLGKLTEDVQEIKDHLAEHDEEIITLRRVK